MEINTIEELNAVINENEPVFQETFNNCENGFAILQLPIECDYKFRDYEDIVEYLHKEPNRNDYKVLYAEEVKAFGVRGINFESSDAITHILEGIFVRFNVGERAENYYGTSVSVSDVIVIKINNETQAYYVGGCGYNKLNNFVV